MSCHLKERKEPDIGRSRVKQGRALPAEGTASGDTLRTESLDYRGNRKVASMTALWVPERAGTEAGRCWSQTSRASWGGIGIEKVLSR